MVYTATSFRILYVSQLANGRDFTTMKEISEVARIRNPESGISGALLFDGNRFCQLIEGPEQEVKALMVAIALDPRHTDVRLLSEAPATGGPITEGWVCGYCETHELDRFALDGGVHGQAALVAFASVLAAADTE